MSSKEIIEAPQDYLRDLMPQLFIGGKMMNQSTPPLYAKMQMDAFQAGAAWAEKKLNEQKKTTHY